MGIVKLRKVDVLGVSNQKKTNGKMPFDTWGIRGVSPMAL